MNLHDDMQAYIDRRPATPARHRADADRTARAAHRAEAQTVITALLAQQPSDDEPNPDTSTDDLTATLRTAFEN